MPKNCPQCGEKITPGYKHCEYCFWNLDTARGKQLESVKCPTCHNPYYPKSAGQKCPYCYPDENSEVSD